MKQSSKKLFSAEPWKYLTPTPEQREEINETLADKQKEINMSENVEREVRIDKTNPDECPLCHSTLGFSPISTTRFNKVACDNCKGLFYPLDYPEKDKKGLFTGQYGPLSKTNLINNKNKD